MARSNTQRRRKPSAPQPPSAVSTPPRPSSPITRLDARPHLERSKPTTVFSALAQCVLPSWFQTTVMISLIFGGCCSNVFALEAIVKAAPGSGHLITFAQFILVAIEGFIYHFDSKSPTFLKPNTIPIYRWCVQIALFFSVSVLNNHAFDYNISVPVHIILRSGGSMTTLLVGWMWGKRFTRLQVVSVVVLTVGCILAALGDSKGMGETESSLARFMTGLAILFVAQVLSAFMGLYIEATYAQYGNNYREGLFYTHALSLLLFIPLAPQMRAQFRALSKSEPLPPHQFVPTVLEGVPRQVVFLVINALTQYVCIRGVNMLGSVSTALTVTIVLNVRKLVSLLLSIWLFGNELRPGIMIGATVVFVGGFMYALESQRVKTRARSKKS